ncbi:ABC transporter substrate-binding protein [Paenibacillus chartarius]|uniref:ABC transporter substrate-binding protein n=1 Tax=Paenibacillus chartarius TaxID=747481 RepID=A0ABV6DIF4_9BACL
MRYKAIPPIIVSLAAALALAGCAGGTPDTGSPAPSSGTTDTAGGNKPANLRVFWWGSQPRHDATNKVLEMYKKENPHVTFQPEFQGFDGYWQKFTLQAATNNMPDVLQFYVGSGDTQQFMDKNLIAPLDDLVAKKLIDVSDVSESALSTGKLGGKLYGIPLGVNAKAMAVDPEMYQKAGLTIPENGYASWEELGKDLAKLKSVTGAYGADDLLGENFTFPYYARQFGQVQYADQTGIGFDEKTYVDFYTMKKNWIQEGLLPPIDVILSIKSPEESNLVKKKSAINIVYTNQFPSISKAAGRELKLIPLPGPNATKAMDLRPGNHFSIPVSSANKEEAAKFISYFINNVEANKVLNAERGMPVAGKVREAIKAGFTPEQKVAADYIDKVSKASSPMDPQPPSGSTEIEKLMLDLEQQILYNKTTPQQAYATLKSEAVKILEKNKK